MYIGSLAFFFIFGTTLGSFLNVVGIRLPQKKTFTKGRSECPACFATLKSYELIPIVSYLMQKGRCRYCSTSISQQYIWLETATGLLFSLCFYQIGWQYELITALLFVSMFLVIFVTDILYMTIPNNILLFFLPLFIILRVFNPLTPWYDPILGAVVGFGLPFLIILCNKGGMGAGDMKLLAVIGVVIGTGNTLLALFIASLIGSIVGMIYLYRRGGSRKQPIPFGPFIVTAAMVCYFYGSAMLELYSQLF